MRLRQTFAATSLTLFVAATVVPALHGRELRSEDREPTLAEVHEELEWLVGTWVGTGFGGHAEEAWLPAMGGHMIGVFRMVQDGELSFTEILTIGEFDGKIELRLKHFHPDMKGWEEKDEFLTFPFSGMQDGKVSFGGLEFIRDGANKLRIDLKMRRGEEIHTEVFRFQRTPR